MDDLGHEFALFESGKDVVFYRSQGEKFDKLTGQRLNCDAAVFEACVLITEKRSRERQDETGKNSDTYIVIQHNEPIYGADVNDNGAEDRVEYPIGSGVMWRVTEVSTKGNYLCVARAEKVGSHEDCHVSEPTGTGIEADIIVRGRD